MAAIENRTRPARTTQAKAARPTQPPEPAMASLPVVKGMHVSGWYGGSGVDGVVVGFFPGGVVIQPHDPKDTEDGESFTTAWDELAVCAVQPADVLAGMGASGTVRVGDCVHAWDNDGNAEIGTVEAVHGDGVLVRPRNGGKVFFAPWMYATDLPGVYVAAHGPAADDEPAPGIRDTTASNPIARLMRMAAQAEVGDDLMDVVITEIIDNRVVRYEALRDSDGREFLADSGAVLISVGQALRLLGVAVGHGHPVAEGSAA